MENKKNEQILVANTVRENLEMWDVAIAAHVESITGEYLYDANQKVPGGVDFVGADIVFKDSVPETAREKIQELVNAALAENIAESMEIGVYRGGVVVDRGTFDDEESKRERREAVLDRQKGNPMTTRIEKMHDPDRYVPLPKIMSGQVYSIQPNDKHPNTVIVGVRDNDRTHGVFLSAEKANDVKLGSSVEVQRSKDGPQIKNLDMNHTVNKGLEL